MKVTLTGVLTADGKFARDTSTDLEWSSVEDKIEFSSLTKRIGVVIMGRKTYETIGKPLPGRLNIVLTSQADPRNNIDGVLEFLSGEPERILEYLSSRGKRNVVLIGGIYTNCQFLNKNLVDEIILTHEGTLLGEGFGFCEGIKANLNLKIKKIRQLSPKTFQVHYKVQG